MKRLAGLITLCCVLSGCGTMFAEKSQKIAFTTKPSKAEVTIGTKTCVTPCALDIDKKQYHLQAVVTKDGFAPQSIVLVPQVEPWTLLNCLGNMCVGVIVDYMTGTMFRYEPEYRVILARNSSGDTEPSIRRVESSHVPETNYQKDEISVPVRKSSKKMTDLQHEEEPVKAKSDSTHTVIVITEKLKLRKKPSSKAPVSKTLKKGEEVQVLKTTENWCLVEVAGGETGWCQKNSLAQKK